MVRRKAIMHYFAVHKKYLFNTNLPVQETTGFRL